LKRAGFGLRRAPRSSLLIGIERLGSSRRWRRKVPTPSTLSTARRAVETALLRQFKEVLEELGYNVVYTSPLAEKESEVLLYTSSIKDIVKEVLRVLLDPYSRIVDVGISIANRVDGRDAPGCWSR